MPHPELFIALLAAVPLLLIVVLMLFLHWPAARAGAAGLFTALALALAVFGYGERVYPDLGRSAAVAGALVEALFTTATILWIIGPAIGLYNLQKVTGGIEVLRHWLGKLSTDPRMAALLVAWFFALFMEGAAGFGTPIALAAPFLVSAGFKPVEAVALALIGHSVGVSFGAVGTPILPQVEATGLSGLELARATGVYHALLGWVMLAILVFFVTRTGGPGSRSKSIWAWAVLAAAAFLVPFFLISRFVGPELPTLGGAFIGGTLFIGAMLVSRRRTETGEIIPAPNAAGLSFLRAAGPYVTLIALVLLTRLLPPIRDTVFAVEWKWSWSGVFSGAFRPFYHPGTLLWLAFFAAIFWLRASPHQVHSALGKTLRQLTLVTIALAAMLGLARIMVHSGMIELTAIAVAGIAGGAWPFFAPFIGVLGTFVTGSATTSNILFTDFQATAAENANLPVAKIVGAQGFGAAVGNIICPHNIIAGGATVGLKGEEGVVLRRTLPACLLYATLGGLLALLLAARSHGDDVHQFARNDDDFTDALALCELPDFVTGERGDLQFLRGGAGWDDQFVAQPAVDLHGDFHRLLHQQGRVMLRPGLVGHRLRQRLFQMHRQPAIQFLRQMRRERMQQNQKRAQH
jgi:lactate permease